MSIQEIFFVVTDNSGKRLIFRSRVTDPQIKHRQSQWTYKTVPALVKSSSLAKTPVFQQNQKDATPTSLMKCPILGFRTELLSKLFCPETSLCNRPLEVVIDKWRFISFPILIPESVRTSQNLSTFSAVFIYPKAESQKSAHIYQDFVRKFSKALETEEFRCHFVSEQVEKMIACREEFRKELEVGLYQRKEEFRKEEVTKKLMDKMVENSLLAKHLRTLHDDINAKRKCKLYINNWCPLRFTLSDPTAYPKVPIRPYQTLLLTTSLSQVLRTLPRDCSPLLREFLKKVDPCKSFQSLGLESNLPMSQQFRLAAHLIYWKKARLIDAISNYFIYVVAPNLKEPIHLGSPLANEFGERFSNDNLPEVLSGYSVHRPLSEHIKRCNRQAIYEQLQILVWLLQKQLVVQLRTYVYDLSQECESEHTTLTKLNTIQTPTANSTLARSRSFPKSHSLQSSVGLGIMHELNMPGKGDVGVIADKGESDESPKSNRYAKYDPLHKQYVQLKQYFNGKHNLVEICWRESMTLQELMTVIRSRPAQIVTVDLEADYHYS